MKANNLLECFKEFQNLKFGVFGDVMLDTYIYSSTDRISPEGPFPVYKYKNTSLFPGGAANVAINLAKMGVRVHLFCIIGSDRASLDFLKIIKNEGVVVKYIKIKNLSMINKVRLISNDLQISRLDFENELKDYSGIISKFYKQINKTFDGIIFSDYAKKTISDPVELIKKCNKLNVRLFIDPKSNNFKKYQGAYCLSPNLSEFENVAGKCHSEKEIILKAKKIIKKYNFENILITLGSKGMISVSKKTSYYSKSNKVFAADVVGAGDTSISHYAIFSSILNDLTDITNKTNTAAEIVVKKQNTSFVTPIDFLKNSSIFENKVIEEKNIQHLIKILKLENKIIFTNGCFDILHAGHVKLFEFCKKNNGILIVGINSDKSIKINKGKNRPINNLKHRLIMMNSLIYIDYIVVFDQKNPLNILKKIKPDILIKGNDYSLKDIVGYDYIKKYGGQVKLFKNFDDLSTTAILNKKK